MHTYTAIPPGVIADLGPNSICVENTNRGTDTLANCVMHHCVQIQGTELMAFSLTVNGKQPPEA